jgi:hypothetical protein
MLKSTVAEKDGAGEQLDDCEFIGPGNRAAAAEIAAQ